MIVHTLKMFTGDAGPKQSLVLLRLKERSDTDTSLKIGNLQLNIEYYKPYLRRPIIKKTEYWFIFEPIIG